MNSFTLDIFEVNCPFSPYPMDTEGRGGGGIWAIHFIPCITCDSVCLLVYLIKFLEYIVLLISLMISIFHIYIQKN